MKEVNLPGSSASGSLLLPTLLSLWSHHPFLSFCPKYWRPKKIMSWKLFPFFYIPSSFSLLRLFLFTVFSKETSLEFVSIVQLCSSQEWQFENHHLKFEIWNAISIIHQRLFKFGVSARLDFLTKVLPEKPEGTQRRAAGMISACLGLLEYSTSRRELEEWRHVQPESKSMDEGVWVRERHSCYLL